MKDIHNLLQKNREWADRIEKEDPDFFHQLAMGTHGVRRGGAAAIDLAYVACGRLDGFWEVNLNP